MVFFFCCLSCCLNSYLTSTGPGGKRSIQPRARLFCEHSVLQKRNHLYHLKAMLVSDRGGRHMGSADKQEAFRMWLCPCWGLLSPLLSGLGLCCCSIFCFIAPLTRLLQSPAGGSVKPCLVPVLSLRQFSGEAGDLQLLVRGDQAGAATLATSTAGSRGNLVVAWPSLLLCPPSLLT